MSKSISLSPLLHLSQVFSDQLCCDLLIKNSEKTFQAHKLVVASSSSYLRSLLVSADHDSQEMTVLLMPGTSSQTIRNFLSISYGLLEDNMDCFLNEMNTDLLFSDIREFCQLENKSRADVEFYEASKNIGVPLLNIELNEGDEFMIKLKEEDMRDLSKIILGQTELVELKPVNKIKQSMDKLPTHSVINGSSNTVGACGRGKSAVCSICGKVFKQTYLSTHIREIHYNKQFSKYECKYCDVHFMRKEKYEGHLSKVHGAPKRYQCTICGKQFGLNSDLFKHRAQVHLTKPKLPCKQCGKLFKTGERLRRHELIHLALRPWECSVCGKSYPRKDKLNSHLKAKHPNIESNSISTTLIP